MRSPTWYSSVYGLQFLVGQGHGQVQGRLAAHGGQYRIDFVFFQYLLDAFHSERQQVYFVSHHWVCHNGCRVTIDQYYFNPFLTEASSGLGT